MCLPGWITGLTPDGAPYVPKARFALYRSRIGDYMDRLIFLCPWGTLRLHRIRKADDARAHLHDHPFDFTSFILSGGYVEKREDGTKQAYFVGSVIRRKATDAHKLTFGAPRTLTLVLSGPRIRRWGFHTPHGWIDHAEYDAYRAATDEDVL